MNRAFCEKDKLRTDAKRDRKRGNENTHTHKLAQILSILIPNESLSALPAMRRETAHIADANKREHYDSKDASRRRTCHRKSVDGNVQF